MEYRKLKELATISISNVDKKTAENEKTVRLCNFVDVYRNWAITENMIPNFMIASAKENEIEKYALHKGDVCITKDSETKDDIGMSTYIADDIDGLVLGYHCALISPDKSVLDGKYLNAFLQTDFVRKFYELNASGSGQRYTLSLDAIGEIPIPVISLEEQKRKGELLSLIDRKIENNNKINDNLCEQIQLLYLYLFNHPSVPEHWNKGVLSDIADITMGQSPAGDSYNDAGEGVPFYQGSTDFGTNFPSIRMYTTKPSRYASVADTLLSVRAPVGSLNTAFEDCCIGRGLAAIHGKHNNNTFVRYTLKNNKWYFDNINNSGTTFGSITKDYLYGMPVIIPDSESILVFERQASLMERQIYDNEQQSRELQGLRDWLLPMLMSGQATIAD